MRERTLYTALWNELAREKAMVFLSGPRQVGKTTFARELIGRAFSNKEYFNWDIIDNKKRLIQEPYFFEQIDLKDDSQPLVIFDEIHKYRHWKNYLKGVYDRYGERFQFTVLGSGRLDVSKKGGEALSGRFLEMHLFPFTVAELSARRRDIRRFLKDPLSEFDINPGKETSAIWQQLAQVSGFPEPFTKGRVISWRRWSSSYGRQIIRDDIRTVQEIRQTDTMEILYSLLPSRVASPLSLNNLAGDLQVSFETVKQWLTLFDYFYLTFRIPPWSKKISRAILKEKKMYLFNVALIEDEAVKFENMVALELWRAVSQWNEWGWGHFGIFYIRNKEKKEVDFVLTNGHKPFLLVEAKIAEDRASESLAYFQNILKIPAVQLVNRENVRKVLSKDTVGIGVFSAHQWLSSLP